MVFKLDEEHIELIKLLKATGLCESGGAAKSAVNEGKVRVDGGIEFRKRCKIRKGQAIEFAGNLIEVE